MQIKNKVLFNKLIAILSSKISLVLVIFVLFKQYNCLRMADLLIFSLMYPFLFQTLFYDGEVGCFVNPYNFNASNKEISSLISTYYIIMCSIVLALIIGTSITYEAYYTIAFNDMSYIYQEYFTILAFFISLFATSYIVSANTILIIDNIKFVSYVQTAQYIIFIVLGIILHQFIPILGFGIANIIAADLMAIVTFLKLRKVINYKFRVNFRLIFEYKLTDRLFYKTIEVFLYVTTVSNMILLANQFGAGLLALSFYFIMLVNIPHSFVVTMISSNILKNEKLISAKQKYENGIYYMLIILFPIMMAYIFLGTNLISYSSIFKNIIFKEDTYLYFKNFTPLVLFNCLLFYINQYWSRVKEYKRALFNNILLFVLVLIGIELIIIFDWKLYVSSNIYTGTFMFVTFINMIILKRNNIDMINNNFTKLALIFIPVAMFVMPLDYHYNYNSDPYILILCIILYSIVVFKFIKNRRYNK